MPAWGVISPSCLQHLIKLAHGEHVKWNESSKACLSQCFLCSRLPELRSLALVQFLIEEYFEYCWRMRPEQEYSTVLVS